MKVKVNSVAPVEAVHWPGLGSDGVGGAGVGVGGAGVGVVGGAGAHPARIMLTTITTVNKGMINFFIFTSFCLPGWLMKVG